MGPPRMGPGGNGSWRSWWSWWTWGHDDDAKSSDDDGRTKWTSNDGSRWNEHGYARRHGQWSNDEYGSWWPYGSKRPDGTWWTNGSKRSNGRSKWTNDVSNGSQWSNGSKWSRFNGPEWSNGSWLTYGAKWPDGTGR